MVKINPDSPQTPVRQSVLLHGKTVRMPSPRSGRASQIFPAVHVPICEFVHFGVVFDRVTGYPSLSAVSQEGHGYAFLAPSEE